MSYSPHTAADRERMLAAIGVGSVDDLFADIPAAVRATRFELPAPLAEQEVRAELTCAAGHRGLTARDTLPIPGPGAVRVAS